MKQTDSKPATTVVRYKNVELHRKELIVLKGIDLTVTKGEFVYLIGKVGSGKSTLIKSLYAEIPVAEGEATVMEWDLNSLRRRDVPMLRREIGVVFQDFQLLTDRSVYDNLAFVLRATGWKRKADIDERIEQVLKEVGMDNKSYKMPHELSGGEQQRIVIARALLNRPSLILADEPTGNLDPETGLQILQLLRRVADEGKAAVIMATHNLQLVEEYPSRTLRCDDKHLVDASPAKPDTAATEE